MTDVVEEKDVIDRQFNSWWRNCWPFDQSIVQVSDYAHNAYRAGYLAAQDIFQSNSCPAPTPKIQELLTRYQRDALVSASVWLAVMQTQNEELSNHIQGALNEISDMLYE